MGEDPSHSLVIEDSAIDVKAAKSTGMKVVGFLGGSHIMPFDKAKLIRAGAVQVFTARERACNRQNLLNTFSRRD